MDPVKNILVCLDATRTDEDLTAYTRFILDNAPSAERVYAINLLKHFEFSKDVLKEFPDLKKDMVNEREEELTEIMKKHLSGIDEKVELIVTPGAGFKTILEVVEKKKIDMVIMGRKTDGTGEGVITFRMSRRCPVTLFIVPTFSANKMEKTLTRLLVPVDFSAPPRILAAGIELRRHSGRPRARNCDPGAGTVGFHEPAVAIH